MILDLSKLLVTPSDLREVAIKGLNMEGNKVEIHIKSNQNEITSVGYNLLREWRDTQQDSRMAYAKLIEALDKAEKPLLKLALGKA